MIFHIVMTAVAILASALIIKELRKMSAQSDRLNQSIATLNNTVNTVVVPALQSSTTAPVDGDSEALFSSAADAVDAANNALLSAAQHPAAASAPVEEPVAQ